MARQTDRFKADSFQDWLEQRRQFRLSSRKSVWAASPDSSFEDESSDEEATDLKNEKVKSLRNKESTTAKYKDEPPLPASEHNEKDSIGLIKNKESAGKDYKFALMPGEGEALAAFVKSGKRIPRRGEIGLQANEIEAFEKVGYVMSGNRHRKMNAVRLRKENQIISAEERRNLLALNNEERKRKEVQTIEEFKSLLSEQIKESQAKRAFLNGPDSGSK